MTSTFFTYDGGLGDGVVLDQRALNLRSAQQMTRDIHAVISASGDPVEAFTVALTTWEPELDDNESLPTHEQLHADHETSTIFVIRRISL